MVTINHYSTCPPLPLPTQGVNDMVHYNYSIATITPSLFGAQKYCVLPFLLREFL